MNKESNRLQVNLELLRMLESYLRAHPDMRFSQALINFGFTVPQTDDFYLEPSELLQRVRSTDFTV